MMDTHQILVLFAHTSFVKIITYRSQCTNAHGIAFLYIKVRGPFIEKFCIEKDIYWRHLMWK